MTTLRGSGGESMSAARALVMLSVLLVACNSAIPDEFTAPQIRLKDLFTGERIDAASYRGRPVILYFFASW